MPPPHTYIIPDYIKIIKELEKSIFFKEIILTKNFIIKNDFNDTNSNLMNNLNIKRILGIPIIIENNIIGVLILLNKQSDYTKDEAQNIIVFINYIYKIIKREIMEKELIRKEKYYKAIVNDIPMLVCKFLPDGTLTFVNDTYSEYFDEPKEKLIGSSFCHLIPEKDKDYVIKKFSSLSYNKPIISYNHRVILKDKRIRWFNCVVHALFDENKNIIEYQSIGRDITEELKKQKK